MNDVAKVTIPRDLIEEYVRLRDHKNQSEDKFKDWLYANYVSRMDEIETQLLSFFDITKSENIRTEAGTAYRSLSTSATILDAKEFQRHVIGAQAWEMIDWRANKTAALEYLEQNKSEPPGVKINQSYRLGVRRPS